MKLLLLNRYNERFYNYNNKYKPYSLIFHYNSNGKVQKGKIDRSKMSSIQTLRSLNEYHFSSRLNCTQRGSIFTSRRVISLYTWNRCSHSVRDAISSTLGCEIKYIRRCISVWDVLVYLCLSSSPFWISKQFSWGLFIVAR